MKPVTFTLSEKQAATLCMLADAGVKTIGAQITQGGLQALEGGAAVLADCNEVMTVLNAAIESAKSEPNRKTRRAAVKTKSKQE